MKATTEDILNVSLKLFAKFGFDAVSTSMIAGELGMTKGALYRHFASKQEIFDKIIEKMFELDEQRSEEDHVPAKTIEEDPESYKETKMMDFCEFVNHQFLFWTENEFAANFRKMITIEQFRNEEMMQLYQDVIAMGPVKYTEDLFKEMLKNGGLNETAKEMGAKVLSVQLFAPLQLMIQLADGGADHKKLQKELYRITEDFAARYGATL